MICEIFFIIANFHSRLCCLVLCVVLCIFFSIIAFQIHLTLKNFGVTSSCSSNKIIYCLHYCERYNNTNLYLIFKVVGSKFFKSSVGFLFKLKYFIRKPGYTIFYVIVIILENYYSEKHFICLFVISYFLNFVPCKNT